MGDQLLAELEATSGVYFLSPFYNPETPGNSILVKVGMAQKSLNEVSNKYFGGLNKRLDSYLLCYPQGFYLYAVLQTKQNQAYPLEKFFHQYFTSKNYKSVFNHSKKKKYNLT